MRSLGAFVGEIVRAVKTDPGQPIKPRGSGAADHSADGCGNQPTAGPDEVVVLRRTTTTVEEVCLRPQDLPRAAGGDRPRRDEGSG
ncbi:MAG: hypothetical protein KatS3mg103_1432 [Phycisphaerales bacterium]|nr:MAG: hypothetical protein KatS3mg103_1432 [Phycisphaerales bacterium]